MPYSLTVTGGPGTRRPEFAFDSEEARLGRTADNDIVVRDPNASRSHCRVFLRDGRHWVEDLKSANGTGVNGTVIQGTAVELKHGDIISIGEVSFSFAILTKPSTEIPAWDPEIGDTAVRGGIYAKANESPRAAVIQTSLRAAYDPSERNRSTKRAPASPRPPPEVPDAQLLHVQVDATDKVPVASTKLSTDELPAAPAEHPPAPDPPLPSTQKPTMVLPARGPGPAPAVLAAPAPDRTFTDEVAAPASLAVAEPAAPAPAPAPAADGVVRKGRDKSEKEDSQLAEPTAAQKARVRRQANKTLGGRLLYAFNQLPLAARLALAAFSVAAVIGSAAGIYVVFAPPPKTVLPPEPAELLNLAPPLEYHFGHGDGVEYERPDLKTFNFKVVSPTRMVGLINFQAREVVKDEVAVSLNGHDLGFLTPTTADRDFELVLPANHIKRNEQNQITFDNVRNPPGNDTWAISNVSLQLFALPELGTEDTLRAVKEDLDRAQKMFELKEIVPDSLFNAWRGYREAWLKLESMPGRPNDLYAIARGQQAEAWKLLDRRCKLMQVDVQRALTKTKPDYATARIVLKDMLRYFPTKEHPCHNMVQEQLNQVDAE